MTHPNGWTQYNSKALEILAAVCLHDSPLGDVFLEDGEQHLEGGHVVPEESCLSNAARVEGGKGDARRFVVAAVELTHGEHVAHLGKDGELLD